VSAVGSRIALTGTGVLSAAGAGASPLFEAMAAGNTFLSATGVGRGGKPLPWATSRLDPAEAPWPSGPPWNSVKKYANAAAHLAVVTARQAVDNAGRTDDFDPARGGTVMAVSSSGGDELGDVIPKLAVLARSDPRALAKFLYDEVPDYSYIRGIPSQLGQFVSMANGFRGSNVAVYGETGVNGLGALSMAHRLIASGELDAAMVVGVSPQPSVSNLATLDREDPLAERADPGCGPFDAGRHGVLVGQGAAALMLEREDHARSRGARILAYVDECEVITAGDRQTALGVAVQSILGSGIDTPGLWWAHAAGSVTADREECEIVRRFLDLPTTSSKGTIGNAFEAAALLDIALATEALGRQEVPPIGLLTTTDTEMKDLDAVVGDARRIDGLASVLVTSLNHGDSSGTAGAVLISKGDPT
jgi:3-oxoacyl-[acyl-carrier-protein] synthase II